MDPLAAYQAQLKLLSDYSAVKYTNIAFLALLVYDYVITLECEISRIWTLRLRLPKILFLINRYIIPPIIIFDALTQQIYNSPTALCTFIAKWTAWPTILSLGTIELMLIIRVSALYYHNKFVMGFLYGLFAVEMAAWIILACLVLTNTTGVGGGGIFSGCLYSAPSYYYAAWVPPVVFESVVIILTLYRGLGFGPHVPTIMIVARDSLVYFAFMFSILIANLFIARYGEGFIGSLLIQPASVIACVAAARMSMNIQELTDNDLSRNTSGTGTATLRSSIFFKLGGTMLQTDYELEEM